MAAAAAALHTVRTMRAVAMQRVLAAIYSIGLIALAYHHVLRLIQSSNSIIPLLIAISILISDIILGFMWFTTQAFRMNPVIRRVNLRAIEEELIDIPRMDIFICTADPYKEPPIRVVNTALSVMAYDYPPEKLSIYVSDDGGSELTLFAFMEAAQFGKHWLPFCKQNGIVDRSPDAYFGRNQPDKCDKIKKIYERMKERIRNVVEGGKVINQYITGEEECEVFNNWATDGFNHQEHPTIIQILLATRKDKDISGQPMPNLIYISRQKNKRVQHNFKAGALNTLLRVSGVMTNAPVILTLDCDVFSNNPKTPHYALCYLTDPSIRPTLGYVQFPQCFDGINKADIYGSEFKRMYHINPKGFDGLLGPDYFGTGCFFNRRAFYGGPSSFEAPEMAELNPEYVVENFMDEDQRILELGIHVASCNYEDDTAWGSKIGFRYGSLVEDYFTGYRMQCEGWKSIFCYPEKPAFLGDFPITLNDVLTQTKRWTVGLCEVAFSQYSPLTFGAQAMGSLMALGYSHYAFSAIWAVPITTYAFLPQLALLNRLSIFPKVSDPWFLLYAFLFTGAYGLDYLDFILANGTTQRWWSDQRMWLVRGLSCYWFSLIEYVTKYFGIPTHGFNVTSKVVDEEERKRYDLGYFEFGANSQMLVPIETAAIISLVSFVAACSQTLKGCENCDGLFVQMFLAGFGVVNCWPIYEAIIFRSDKGKIPAKTTFISTLWASILCIIVSLLLKM